jgi:peptidoglycan/xylan/chitin deacetylase (PgdA/CDA1 family)
MANFDHYNNFLNFWKLPRHSVIFNTGLSPARNGIVTIRMPCETFTNPELYTWGNIHFFAPIADPRAVKNKDISDLIKTNNINRVICLPFNLNIGVQNLLTELYVKKESDQTIFSIARWVYYMMKPWLPRPILLALRRKAISLMGRRSFPAWPVDTSVENLYWSLLRQVLSLDPKLTFPIISFWPNGAKSCLVITHDVEFQTRWDQISNIISLEQKYGVRSAWNFVPERYQVDHRILQKLQAEGYEIGVHGLKHDGRLFTSYQKFRSHSTRINIYLRQWGSVGFRSESNLRNLDWMSENLQIEYDSSCLSSELYGAQPGGSCTIFPFMYDNLVEIPITLQQDFTLLEIMQLSSEATLQNWIQTVRIIQAYSGMVLINIHPDYMLTSERLNLYERFLGIVTNYPDYWNALPCEVARWWRDRQGSDLVQVESDWRIEGPAANRGIVMRVLIKEKGLLIEPYSTKS